MTQPTQYNKNESNLNTNSQIKYDRVSYWKLKRVVSSEDPKY